MLDAVYRPFVQDKLVNGPTSILVRWGIHPNHITLMAVVSGVAVLPSLVLGFKFLAFVLLWLSGYLDMLDGSVARASKPYDLGAVLDILGDRVVEAAILMGLFYVSPMDRGGLCLLMMASILICVTSFLVVGIFSENESEKGFHYSPGLIERAEAFIFFSLMIWFDSAFDVLASLFCVLVVYTTAVRVWQFKRLTAHSG